MRFLPLLAVSALSTTLAFAAGCASETTDDADESSGAASTGFTLPDDYAYAWNGGGELPEASKWAPMYARGEDIAKELNAQSGKYALKPKEIGGSSLYAYVDQGDQRLGLWLPPNASTWILEEIFAFNLSRLFGHGDWAAPASRLTLDRDGSAAYRRMLEGMNPRGIQACNKDHQMKYMGANPNYFIGIYKEFGANQKVGEVKSLVKDDGLNGDHSLARLLARDARAVTDDPAYLVKGANGYNVLVKGDAGYEAASAEGKHVAQAPESVVVASLNHMLVVDVLNNQRDRYGSGTNMQFFHDKTNNTFRMALIDNGGGSATIPTKYVNDFKRKVTRFDQQIASDVLALDAFVNQGIGSFKGFDSEDALKRALGYEDNDNVAAPRYTSDCGSWDFPSVDSYKARWDLKWKNFKKALTLLAEHVRASGQTLR